MGRFNFNVDILTPRFFLKRPLLVFFVHWIAWILLYFLTYIPTLVRSPKIPWETVWFNYVVLGSVNFLLFYLVAFYLLPQIGIKRKRWIWLIVICVAAALIFCYLKFRIERAHAQMMLERAISKTPFATFSKPRSEPEGPLSYLFNRYLQNYIYNTISILFIAFAYRMLITWYLQEKVKTELESQKLNAELSFLKMQVNPHFLFNALNNIYSLAVIENSNKTGNSILKLSELMRYMLYEKEDAENKVSLDKEIRHINNYIDLEKLRHIGDIYVSFSLEGDIAGKRVAPLLLFPLIENSFKHGLLTDPAKPVTIAIKVNGRLDVLIDNYNNNYVKDSVGGIGMENVKKRLDLLYGNSYRLNIDNTNGRHVVNLSIPL